MAKLTLNDIAAGYVSVSTINANNALIEAALENTLSRDGTSPNTMSADLDMNSNQVKNVTDPTDDQDAATKGYIDGVVASSIAGQISGTFNVGTSWDWTAQQDFQAGIRIQDVGGTDSVTISHDGTDLNLDGTLTTDININDGMVLKIWDADESDHVSISHDGSDAVYGGVDVGRFHDFVEADGTPGRITARNLSFSAASDAGSGVIWGNSAGDDSMSMTVTGDGVNIEVSTGVMSVLSLGNGTFPVHLDGTDVSYIKDFTALQLKEQSDHPITPAATYGQLWVKETTPNTLMFTDDAGGDQALTQVAKYKASDLVRASTTTPANDSELVGFQLEASTAYEIEGLFLYNQNVGDIQISLSYSAALTRRGWIINAVDDTGVTYSATSNSVSSFAITTMTDTDDVAVHYRGIVITGGSAPVCDVQWAQNTNSVNATTLQAGSYLKFKKL